MTSSRDRPQQDDLTSLEVITQFVGVEPTTAAIDKMTTSDFDDLQALIMQAAHRTLTTPAPEHTYYPGGFLAGHWQHRAFSTDLNLALLYYPRLLVHDPLADFFFDKLKSVPSMHPLTGSGGISVQTGPAVWAHHGAYESIREDREAVRSYLKRTVQYLRALEPLVSEQILILRPQWPTIVARQTQLVTSVRHDVRRSAMQEVVESSRQTDDVSDLLPVWDHLWGGGVTPSGMLDDDKPWVNQNEFFYLAKTLAVADQAGATYVAPHQSELNLLRAKLDQVIERLPRSVQPTALLRDVGRLLLPDLELDVERAVDIRRSEEDFDDWRRSLSRLAREGQDDDLATLSDRVEDELLPVVHRVERAVSRSGAMSAVLKEQSATTIISGSAAALSAAATGGNPMATATGALGGGVLLWLWKAYRPPKLGGVDAVVASLLRRHK